MNIKLALQRSTITRDCEECDTVIKADDLYYRLIVLEPEFSNQCLCRHCGSIVSALPEASIKNCDTVDELLHEADWYDREMKRSQWQIV